MTFEFTYGGTAPGPFITAQNGDWEDTLTWIGHVVPGATDSAVVRHRVNVTSTTGSVTVGAITMHTDSADADLDIYSGTTFTVARDFDITNRNLRDYHVDLIVRNGSELIVTGDLNMERSFGNTSAKRCRLYMYEASKLSCDNFEFKNNKSGTEGQYEVYMRTNSSIAVAGDLTWTHGAQRDFNVYLDSSAITVGGQARLTNNAGARDFRMDLIRSSSFTTVGHTTFRLQGGDDFYTNLNGASTLDIGGNFNQFHQGGDDLGLTARGTSEVKVAGMLFIDQHIGDHYNSFINDAKLSVTGDYRLDKDGGLTTGLNFYDNATGSMFRVNQNINGSTSTTIHAEDNTTVNILDEYQVDLIASTSTTMLRGSNNAVINLAKNITINQGPGTATIETELNGTSTMNLTGNYLVTTNGGGANNIDLNGGTMNVSGATGVRVNIQGNTSSSSTNLSNGSTLDIKAGHLLVYNNANNADYTVYNYGGSILIDGNYTMYNQPYGRHIRLYTYNGAVLDGSTFRMDNNGTQDMTVYLDNSDVDFSGSFTLQMLGGDDVSLTTNGTTTLDIGTDLYFRHMAGDRWTTNFRGTSVVNYRNLYTTYEGNGYHGSYVSQSAVMTATGDAVININAPAGSSYDFRTQDKARSNFNSNVTISSNNLNALFSADDTCNVAVRGNITFTTGSNNSGSNRVDLNQDATMTVGGNITFNQNAGTSICEVEVGGTSELTVAGNVLMDMTAGRSTQIDVQQAGTLTINGGTGLTINSNNNTQTSSLNVRYAGAKLDVTAGDILVTLNTTSAADFYTNIDSSTVNTKDFIYTYTNGDDGLFYTNRSADINVSGDFTMVDNGLGDDMVFSLYRSDMDVAGRVRLDNNSAGTSGSPDCSFSTNGDANLNVVGDIRFYHRAGRNFNVNFSGNNYGGSKTNATSLAAYRGISAVGLYVNTSGNNSNSGELTLSNLVMQQAATIHFNGSAAQVIPSRDPGAVGGDLFRYSNIELDNAAGFTMGAGGAEMTDTMYFTDGILYTTAADQMTFVGARALGKMPIPASHIAGPATKRGAGDFVFPLGKDGKVGKLGISNPGNSGNFTGEYFRGVPTDNLNLEPTMKNISSLEWWELNRNSGSASTYVTLYWERADSAGIENGADLRVAHYTGSIWEDEWKSAITGSTSGAGSGSITTQNPISSFSPFTFGSNSNVINPLPVTLTTFKAKLVEPTKALVEWETVTEINNDYFEVLRSFNGNDFETIQTVKGAGNSNAPIAYNIVDPNLAEVGSAYAFYKLKQVDFDGKVTYSKVIPLALNADSRNFSSLKAEVTPNPYKASLNINLHNTAATATPVKLKIMDAFGRTILTTDAMSEAGFTTKSINMENYAAGVYFVVVEHNGISKTIKTIKQ